MASGNGWMRGYQLSLPASLRYPILPLPTSEVIDTTVTETEKE